MVTVLIINVDFPLVNALPDTQASDKRTAALTLTFADSQRKQRIGSITEEVRMRRKQSAADIVAKARKAMPHVILQALAKEYKGYVHKSKSEAEEWFWVKCSRAAANLGSGMEKWLDELLDDDEAPRRQKRRKHK